MSSYCAGDRILRTIPVIAGFACAIHHERRGRVAEVVEAGARILPGLQGRRLVVAVVDVGADVLLELGRQARRRQRR